MRTQDRRSSDTLVCDWEGSVDAGGVRLHVVRAGTGPELLVIHGGPDWDHTYLRGFMDSLRPHAHMVFFDLRGCGRSARFQEASELHVRHAAEDIRNLVSELELDRPAILGFGFGGRIGLELLARHPGLVGRFILASSSAYAIGTTQKSFLPRGFPAAGGGNEMRNFALDAVEAYVHRPARRAAARSVIGRLRFSTQWMETIRDGLPIADPGRIYTRALVESEVPTLVLHGDSDRRFPVTEAERLVSEVPHARLCVLPEAGHFAHIDATPEWNAAIADFLRSS